MGGFGALLAICFMFFNSSAFGVRPAPPTYKLPETRSNLGQKQLDFSQRAPISHALLVRLQGGALDLQKKRWFRLLPLTTAITISSFAFWEIVETIRE